MFFDPDQPKISEDRFHKHDWADFYRDAKEDIPTNAPEPRGKEVSMHCFVDASHGSDKATRRSQTGVLIFINRARIISISRSIFLSLSLNTFRVLDWTVSNSHILLQN